MKIKVGKKYEGSSSNFYMPDGDYQVLILDAEETKTSVKLVMATPNGRRIYKTFFVETQDGEPNEKMMRDLADLISCAIQSEDDEIDIDVSECVGCFVQITLKNGSYEKDGLNVATQYINNPKRCDPFDGAQALMDKYMKGKKKPRNANKAKKAEKVEEPEQVEETEGDDLLGILGDI